MGYKTALKITYLYCIEAEEWLFWVHGKTENSPQCIFRKPYVSYLFFFFSLLMYPRIVQSVLVILGLNTSHKE